ncbi:MAG: phage tail protein [Pseudomonadota bacterium]
MPWINLAILAITTLISVLLSPRPPSRSPQSLEDANLPVAELGREVPVLFGSRRLDSPQVVWRGNYRNSAIRSGPFWARTRAGYRYFLDLHFVWCLGPIDFFARLDVGDNVAWLGRSSQNGTQAISDTDLFGGDRSGGGISGVLRFLFGASDQAVDPFLDASIDGTVPAHRGVFSLVLENFYHGTSRTIRPARGYAERILVKEYGEAQWYPETAPIPQGSITADGTFIPSEFNASNTQVDVPLLGEVPLGGLDDDTPPLTIFTGDTSPARARREALSNGGIIVEPGNDGFYIELNAGTFQQVDTNFYIDLSALTGFSGYTSFEVNTSVEAARGNPPTGSGILISMRVGGDVDTTDTAAQTTFSDAFFTGPFSVPNNTDFTTVATGFQTFTQQGRYLLITVSGGRDTFFRDYRITLRGSLSTVVSDMNAIHIVRELLTSRRYGLGVPEAQIDDANFRAAADTIFAEGLGLSLLWTRQEQVEEFLRLILSHIDAQIFINRTTGLWNIKLIRDDYTVGNLITLDEASVSSWEIAERQESELVNQVTVLYWDRTYEKQGSLTTSDTAQIPATGGIIPQTSNYPGVTSDILAARLADRDLLSSSSPLLSGTIRANRTAAPLNPGDAFVLNSAKRGVDNLVCRVTEIVEPASTEAEIRVTFLQDAFVTRPAPVVSSQVTPDIPLVSDPQDVTFRAIEEAPYYLGQQIFGATTFNASLAANSGLGYLAIGGARPSGDSISAEVAISEGGAFSQDFTMDFAPSAVLAADVSADPTVVTWAVSGFADFLDVEVGSYAKIDEELVRIDSVGQTSIAVGRGVLDTVPRAHTSGTTILFVSGEYVFDQRERDDGDSVDVKLLTTTARGILEEEDSATTTVTFANRAIRPYPVGNLQVDGSYAPSISASPWTATWAHRDRLTQDLATDAADGDVGPEAGVTYRVDVYAASDADTRITLLASTSGVTATTFDVDEASWSAAYPGGTAGLLVEVVSVRDGFTSFQAPSIFQPVAVTPSTDAILLSGDAQTGSDRLALSGDTGVILISETS